MKSFSIFFSVYLILLSMIPCGDGEVNFVDTLRQVAGMGTHHYHEGHQHEDEAPHTEGHCGEEHCSPLCACGCCSINLDNTIHWGTISMIPPSSFPQNFNFAHHLQGISLFDIWHPPAFA